MEEKSKYLQRWLREHFCGNARPMCVAKVTKTYCVKGVHRYILTDTYTLQPWLS